jgi:hypothetical protein
MAWKHQPASSAASFAEPLDYTGIIFQHINDCRKAVSNGEQFLMSVQVLSDLLTPYYDEQFDEDLKDAKIQPNAANPYQNAVTIEEKVDHARAMLRALVKLVHRSGFMPEKRIEGVLDENVIWDFWLRTNQLTDDEKREGPSSILRNAMEPRPQDEIQHSDNKHGGSGERQDDRRGAGRISAEPQTLQRAELREHSPGVPAGDRRLKERRQPGMGRDGGEHEREEVAISF